MICDACGHRWSHTQCTVILDDVVGEIIERNRSRLVLQLARESAAGGRGTSTGERRNQRVRGSGR